MEQTFEEFCEETSKKRGPKKMKITNSWGVYDAYKLIRKNGWYNIGMPVTEYMFYHIIRSINKLLAENLANGNTVILPARMGKLELRKIQRGVSIVNGKLKNTYPINWEETLRLWFEDEEAKKNKTLLRNEQEWVYCIKYSKFNANYSNQMFYQFTLNKFIKQALKVNIKNNKVDALW